MTIQNTEQWQSFVKNSLDFRPQDGVYRISRDMFTKPELFELEMELIFEKVWIYACHESEIANNNDFVTVTIGRQSGTSCLSPSAKAKKCVASLSWAGPSRARWTTVGRPK